MKNSGVSVDTDSDHFCSASDKNPIRASTTYFGIIEEIWEVDYSGFRVSVFKCKWVNVNIGVHEDPLEFTLVDLSKVAYMDGPFIMAKQAKQVFTLKIHVIQDFRWFYKEDQVESITIMMIQPLTFVRHLLFPKEFLLWMKLMTSMMDMQII